MKKGLIILLVGLIIGATLGVFGTRAVLNNKENTAIVKNTEKKTPLEKHGKLHVDGMNVYDQNNNIFQIRGISTHGLGMGIRYSEEQYSNMYAYYANYESFKSLRDFFGINAVRLAMYPSTTAGNHPLTHDMIKNAVKDLNELGLYAIIDWHTMREGDPNNLIDDSKAFFTEMASEFKDYSNVLYEICNEPNDTNNNGNPVTWEDNIKPYALEIIKIIRSYNKDAIITIGTPGFCHDIKEVADNPITGYSNLLYSFHFYAGNAGEPSREKLRYAIEKKLPVYISECGMVNGNGDGAVGYESAQIWMKILQDNNLGFTVWQLSNKSEGSSLIKSTCYKLSNWKYEDLSDHCKLLYDYLHSIPAQE